MRVIRILSFSGTKVSVSVSNPMPVQVKWL